MIAWLEVKPEDMDHEYTERRLLIKQESANQTNWLPGGLVEITLTYGFLQGNNY